VIEPEAFPNDVCTSRTPFSGVSGIFFNQPLPIFFKQRPFKVRPNSAIYHLEDFGISANSSLNYQASDMRSCFDYPGLVFDAFFL
jgi:hypothetical protein